jgi:hypothetical protein
MADALKDLKEVLHHIADTIGRPQLHADIDNLDGNIDATPPPPDEGEAEKIAAQIADLQKRQAEITPAVSEGTKASEEG